LAGSETNAVDIRQRNFDSLLAWEVDSRYSGHAVSFVLFPISSAQRASRLALALLVSRIRADNAHDTLSANHPTSFAPFGHRRRNLHVRYLSVISVIALHQQGQRGGRAPMVGMGFRLSGARNMYQ
jgi:hypothetical protein